MIFTERTINVRKGTSKMDEPVILYRGDYDVEIRFTIVNSKFRFLSDINVIANEKASYAQLAILTPYGGNIFSDITECNEGTVTFELTKEMLDQIEEVGLYSFQIRLFDYNKNSRVTIPPVEFGIEVREPITSEDHDNSVNNAIVGYSIAKIVDPKEENIGPTFDGNGNYNETKWKTGDRITEGKLNKIEDAIDIINQNAINEHVTLDRRITINYNVLESKIDSNYASLEGSKADMADVDKKVWSMANMGQDVKAAMTGGSVAVVGDNAVLENNIVDKQVTNRKLADNSVDGRTFDDDLYNYHKSYVKVKAQQVSAEATYVMVTIDKPANLKSGDKLYAGCTVICNSDSDITIQGVGVGFASTNHDDNTNYIPSTIVPGYIAQPWPTYDNVANCRKHVVWARTLYDTNDSDVQILNNKYLILVIKINGGTGSTFETVLSNIWVQINENGPIIEIEEPVYGGTFRPGYYQNNISISYGRALGEPYENYSTDICEAMRYNMGKFHQLNLDEATSDSWVLLTIPNILGEVPAGDIIHVRYKGVYMDGLNATDILRSGVGASYFKDGRDIFKGPIDKFTSTATGATSNQVIKGELTDCDTYLSVSESTAISSTDPYLFVGFRIGANSSTDLTFAVSDVEIAKNDEELISIDDMVLHRGLFMENDPTRSKGGKLYVGEGIGGILTEENGVAGDIIHDSSITINKISNITKKPEFRHIHTMTASTAQDHWVLATIKSDYIVIEDGFINIDWKIEPITENLIICPNSDWCFGYTEYLDATEFSGYIPGFVNYSSGELQYKNGHIIAKLPASKLPEPVENKIHLCVGFKICQKDDTGAIIAPNKSTFAAENTSSHVPFSFIHLFQAAKVSINCSTVKEPLNDEYLITNKSLGELDITKEVPAASGKYISILGDSISTYVGWIPSGNVAWYTGETSDIENVTQTWWYQAIRQLEMKLCVNNSWSGSRVTTTGGDAAAGCMTRCQSLHTADHDPDVIIVYIGINDYNNGVDIGSYDGSDVVPTTTTTFREAYAIMLDKILTRYQTSRVYVCTLPYCDRNTDDNPFPEKNQDALPLWKYNDAIRQLANAFGVEIIELSKCGITYHNRNKYLTDELHPLQIGMDLITRKVVNSIKDL